MKKVPHVDYLIGPYNPLCSTQRGAKMFPNKPEDNISYMRLVFYLLSDISK